MKSKIDFVDVTLRDAHQCLWSTRMTTEMMTPILSTIDNVGFAYVNLLGGAVFDVCVRYLQENPWERIRTVCGHLNKTPVDALTRGQSLYTFQLFPDDLIELNIRCLAANGVSRLTVYDALNDCRNLETSIVAAHQNGMTVSAWMVYTVSPVHTDEYYQARTSELVNLGADQIGIKDPAGLLTLERAKTLLPAVASAANGVPLELHSHCQLGMAPDVYVEAMQHGYTYLQTAVSPLANGASLPPIEYVEQKARQNGFETNVNLDALQEMAGYFRWLCYREKKPMGQPVAFDPFLLEHQVPGGMISNLKSQLKEINMENRLNEILEEAVQVRKDLGYPILVSPFAQYVITQAVLNVVQGERYKTVPDEVRKYALGYYGRLAAPPSDYFLERARIDLKEQRTERAGDYLHPVLPRLRKELGAIDDEELLLAAFFDENLRKQIISPRSYQFHTSPLVELIRYLNHRPQPARFSLSFGDLKLNMDI
jgi:pyruvate/oxaloacetate carboxyltransferase